MRLLKPSKFRSIVTSFKACLDTLPYPRFQMRSLAWTFVLATFFLSPLTLFGQRLSLTPPAVTIMEGDSGEFTVMLSSEPTANVTVTIVRTDGAEVRLDKTVLIFTPSNWNVAQTVTLTAEEDEDSTDDEGTLILIASGGGYDGDGVIVTPEIATIDSLGKSIQLSATVQDQDGSPVVGVSFDWSSSDSSVAVVDSTGKVTAVTFGTTKITATLATITGTATISGEATVRVGSGITEREALVALYNATDGPNWVDNTNWLTDAPLAQWYGVDTDNAGRVVSLDLGGRWDNETRTFIPHGLTGPIPPEFGGLANLTSLNLSINILTGPIPPELGNLAKLRNLWLSENNLTGPIYPELASLANLESLDLGFNDLTGPIPPELGSLANLESLRLSDNNLTGSIPPELGSLANLESLDLGSNDLTGPIPSELGGLANLTRMNLWQNDLTGPIPTELGGLAKLGTLWLASNNLTGPIPPELGGLASVWQLSLARNALAGTVPPELDGLTKLNTLYLNDNDLTGTIPPSFRQLSELNYFGFGNNSSLCLPDILIGWFENLRERNGPVCPDREALRALYDTAGGNDWINTSRWLTDGPLGEWYGVDLDSSGRVSTVDLAGNGLSGGLSRRLGELAGLTALRIGDNALTGRLPFLLRLTPLRELRYANTGPVRSGQCIHSRRGSPEYRPTRAPGRSALRCRTTRSWRSCTTRRMAPTGRSSSNWLTDAPLGQWHGVNNQRGGSRREPEPA